MRTPLGFLAVLVLFPAAAAAQTTTDDGIRALLRGDYQTALRILQPLAEDTQLPDPVAQFFMGILYDAGAGVQRDELRACRMFLRSATPDNPFGQPSSALADFLQQQLAPIGPLLCATAGNLSAPPRASFRLGPTHWIAMNDTTITISYNGTEHRTALTANPPGRLYLPLRYTPLEVSRPASVRRHFIESFVWRPDAPGNTSVWTLAWTLSEVVDGDYVPIASEASLVTSPGPLPPFALNVDGLALVRLNANGEVEWVVTSGPNPRGAVVPWRRP